MKKYKTILFEVPAFAFLIIFILVATALHLIGKDFQKQEYNSYHYDIWVEAHGLLFDLMVFGVIFSIYDAQRQKKERKRERIEKYKSIIRENRNWPSQAATNRIMEALRNLIEDNEKSLNLTHCYLNEANFANWDLSETHFDMTTLHDARFYQTVLTGSTFQEAKLKNAAFYSVDLTGADFSGADLEGVNFSKANLSNVTLEGAIVWPPHIYILEEIGQKTYPFGSDDWFRKLETDGVIGWEEIENKYYVDEFGILRLK